MRSRTTPAPLRRVPLSWAKRLKRVFGIDIASCSLCGWRLWVIGDVTDPEVVDAGLSWRPLLGVSLKVQ